MKHYSYLACVAASAALLAGCNGSSGGGGGGKAPERHVFAASNGIDGSQLWITDGTSDGTKMVKNIAGNSDANPHGFTRFGDAWFFTAQDNSGDVELWKTDGTEAGTVLVKDINAADSSYPNNFIVMGDALYFVATDQGGEGLFKTQGTAETTVRVFDSAQLGITQISAELQRLGNTLYFGARTDAEGTELWSSDGTQNGTQLTSAIAVGTASSHPTYLTIVGDTLFFAARDNQSRRGLWKVDNQSATPELVSNNELSNSSNPNYLTAVGDQLFFAANGARGVELYVSNGEASGTRLVKDISAPGGIQLQTASEPSSHPRDLYHHNGTLYFAATTAADGSELWKSDGTAAGTVMVKSIASAAADSNPHLMFSVGTQMLFVARDDTSDSLWVTDGTEAGTQLMKNFTENNSDSEVISLGRIQYQSGETLMVDGSALLAADGVVGVELWKTDGTTAGTTLVKDINEGAGDSLRAAN